MACSIKNVFNMRWEWNK